MRDPELFETRYRAEGDIWQLASSPYERGRYHQLLHALPRGRYRSAYEPGCSVGVLTELLAERCDRLLAVDLAPTAVTMARRRCRARPNVEIRTGALQDDPGHEFDLVVLSEVGYYLTEDDLARAVHGIVASLAPGGDLVACHWLGHSEDHRLHGDLVHEVIDTHPALRHQLWEDHEDFRLDVWRRT